MALSAQEQRDIAVACVRQDVAIGQAFKKSDLTAAVAAVDQWCTDNATSYNTALPATFRTTATTAQKNIMLAYVCLKRAGVV